MKDKRNTAIRNYLCNNCHVKMSSVGHPGNCPHCGYTMSLIKNHPLERDTTPHVAEAVNMYTGQRAQAQQHEEALVEVWFDDLMAGIHEMLYNEAEMDKYAE